MRTWTVLALALQLLFATLHANARGSETSLILGFEQTDTLRLVSTTSSDRSALTRNVPGPQWTVSAIDTAGDVQWRRHVVEPRLFHSKTADSRAALVISVPRPVPGDTLRLVDSDGRVRWTTKVEPAFLEMADARGRMATLERDAALAVTRGLGADDGIPKALRLVDVLDGTTGPRQAGDDGQQSRERVELLRHRRQAWLAAAESGHPGARTADRRNRSTAYDAVEPMQRTAQGRVAVVAAEDGWVLDVELRNSATGEPVRATPQGYAYADDDAEFRHFPLQGSNGRLRVVVPREPLGIYRIFLDALPGHAPQMTLRVGGVQADTAKTFLLHPARPAALRIVVESGFALPDGASSGQCSTANNNVEVSYADNAPLDAGGAARMSLPYDTPFYCSVFVGDGRLFHSQAGVRFPSATPVVITLPATSEVTITLRTEAGANYVGDTSGLWAGNGTQARCHANPCNILLPRNMDALVYFYFFDGIFADAWIGPQRFAPGSRHTLLVRESFTIGGEVQDEGIVGGSTRVRAFDAANGKLVVSTMTNWTNNRFELPVPRGRYQIEVENQTDYYYPGKPFLRTPLRTPAIDVATHRELPRIVVPDSSGTLIMSALVPCSMTGGYHRNTPARLLLIADDGARVQRTVLADTASSTQTEPCITRYPVTVDAGSYTVEFSPLGWPPRMLGSIAVSTGQSIERIETFPADERSLVWRDTIRQADGASIANAWIDMYDEGGDNRISWRPDAYGGFDIPFQPGWTVEIAPDPSPTLTTMSHVQRLGNIPPTATLALGDLPHSQHPEDGLLRIHGNGDRDNRINIIFIAEGYSDNRESFTDINGNGIWDGVVWLDLDQNEVFSYGDLLEIYGTASYPAQGSVPGLQNEPFVDSNEDGFPSLDDRATFLANSRMFMRSLLGSDVWNAHRDAFNAYVLFADSEQAGYSVLSAQGRLIVERKTRYGARLSNGILFVDQATALVDALAVLPEADVAVILINQAIRGGRSNASFGSPAAINFAAGPHEYGALPIASHEMAHALGGLCDEYTESLGFARYVSAVSTCLNASYSADTSKIPWAGFLDLGDAIPSRNVDDSIGVFEGASFYASGTYRPSYTSMMRDLSPLFNAPSRTAIKTVIESRTGPTRPSVDGSGRCLRLPINSVRRRNLDC